MKYDTVIVDYGVGNVHSVLCACRQFTESVAISDDPSVIADANRLILPGVGAFKAGMDGLAVRGLTQTILAFAASGKPVLGVCLGAQMLLSKGHEFGEWNGLGLIPGEVVPFPPQENLRLPHIGWNALHEIAQGEPFLAGVKEGADVYFVHSYILAPEDPRHVVATARYGDVEFPAVLRKGNLYGCQFHPEKSAAPGLAILKNFLALASS